MPRKRVQINPALVDKARHAGRVQWYNKLLTDGNLQAAEQYAAKHLLLPLGGAGVSQSNGIAIPNQLPPSENFSANGIASQNSAAESLDHSTFKVGPVAEPLTWGEVKKVMKEVVYAPFPSYQPVSITVGETEEMINFCATHGREATHSNPDGSPCCNPALGGIMVSCRVWSAPARLMPLLGRRDADGRPVPAAWGPGSIPAGHFYTAEQAIALPPEAALPSPEADFATFKAGDAPLTSELSNSTTAADFAAWVDADPTSHQTVTFTPSEPLQEFKPALEPLPQGVRWATVIREPHNQRMKLVRFADGGQEGIAWVGMRDVARAGGRMNGIMIRVVPNTDELQGGWMIWRG